MEKKSTHAKGNPGPGDQANKFYASDPRHGSRAVNTSPSEIPFDREMIRFAKEIRERRSKW